MDPVRPELVPDGTLDREQMDRLQREVAEAAVFDDEPSVSIEPIDDRLVAGIDQAFLDDRAVSAVVVRQRGRTVERCHAVTPLSQPYVPGYLSFREGPPIVAALQSLTVEPDLFVFDGSGRIHYRQAGLATHLGVVFDRPSIGVTKRLLCGQPRGSIDGLAVGESVIVEADDDVDASPGTAIGAALQTRQFTSSNRHINPVYVSPGHRVGLETAVETVRHLAGDYKLPEPVRQADRYAAEVKERRS